MLERALCAIDSAYPYPMNEENLRIEYETLFDRPVGSSRTLSIETMTARILHALGE
jgi:hypothetical protein